MPIFKTEIDGKEFKVDYADSDVKIVSHCDLINEKIGSVKRTDEGYLTGVAPIAKVGILRYALPDGSVLKEFVPPSTLFNDSSMSSLHMKPVTDKHPPEKRVDAKNSKTRKVGFTGERAFKKDNFLMTSLTVTDQEAIDNVDGGRRELSPGYTAKVLYQSGEFNGEKYDAIQLSRKYNHVALCDRARGGAELRLNIDSLEEIDGAEFKDDAVLTTAQRNALPDSDFCFVRGSGENKVRKFPAHDARHIRNAFARLPQSSLTPSEQKQVLDCLKSKAKKFNIEVNDSFQIDERITQEYYSFNSDELLILKRGGNMPFAIKIDGVEYEVPQQVKIHLEKLDSTINQLNDSIKVVTGERDKLSGEKDALQGKIDSLSERDLTKEIADGVKIRSALVKTAGLILDSETMDKVDSLSNKEIKIAVIKSQNKEIDLTKKSDDYIDARFDTVVEFTKKDSLTAMDRQRMKTAKPVSKEDKQDSQSKMQNYYLNAWKEKN